MVGNRIFSIVVVDYKSADKTIDYIYHLKNKLNEMVDIVIVDNSVDYVNTEKFVSEFGMETDVQYSEYGEVSFCKYEYGMLYLINPNKNLGYAKGNNLGVFFASKELKSKYSIISNNDIKISGDYLQLDKFKSVFNSYENVAIVGPKIVGQKGENQSPCKKKSIWTRWIFMSLIYPYHTIIRRPTSSDLLKNAEEGIVYRVQGSFFALRNDIFVKVGGFDPFTFLYAEEMILSEKFIQFGYKVYYLKEIQVLHEHSQTISNHYDALKRMRIRFESEMYYYKTYLHVPNYQLKLAVFLFKWYERKYIRKNP